MIKIKEAIIVEGKYDKIKLSGIIDTLIIETQGFSIFKDKEKQNFIRKLASKRGILILTDSDAAGFKIRSFIGGSLPQAQVKHAYIPDILGKEKRKDKFSKEGKLGVEGMSKEVLLIALEKAGISTKDSNNVKKEVKQQITNADLYEFGLSGTNNSKQKRIMFLDYLSLPSRLRGNALLKTLNTFLSYEEFLEAAKNLSP